MSKLQKNMHLLHLFQLAFIFPCCYNPFTTLSACSSHTGCLTREQRHFVMLVDTLFTITTQITALLTLSPEKTSISPKNVHNFSLHSLGRSVIVYKPHLVSPCQIPNQFLFYPSPARRRGTIAKRWWKRFLDPIHFGKVCIPPHHLPVTPPGYHVVSIYIHPYLSLSLWGGVLCLYPKSEIK